MFNDFNNNIRECVFNEQNIISILLWIMGEMQYWYVVT